MLLNYFTENMVLKLWPSTMALTVPGSIKPLRLHNYFGVWRKITEGCKDLQMAFFDIEKLYDRAPQDFLRILEKEGANITYVQVIKDTYIGATTNVHILEGVSKRFSNNNRLAPMVEIGSIPFFTLILYIVTRYILELVPQYSFSFFFVDDNSPSWLVKWIKFKIELCRKYFELKDFWLSRRKKE